MKNMKIKINHIINYIKEINPNEFKALIIISVNPFYFTSHSISLLEELLNKILNSPSKILKKKEKEMITPFDLLLDNAEIKRNLSLTFDDHSEIISESHLMSKNEKLSVKFYIEDYKNKLNSSNNVGIRQIKNLIFQYEIKFIDKDENKS
jgi:hypothetical protein